LKGSQIILKAFFQSVYSCSQWLFIRFGESIQLEQTLNVELKTLLCKNRKKKKELKSHLFTRTATDVIECQAVALRCKASRMCTKGLVEEEEEVSKIWIFIWRYLAILIPTCGTQEVSK